MTVIKVFEKPKLKNPIFIEGLPGVGNIGRVAVGYMIEELGAKNFAELYSRHFFPFVMLHEDYKICLLYTSPSPRDQRGSRMPSSA